MLTLEEKRFIEYWSLNRLRKKRSLFQFSIGLPLGVLIIAALFANIITGWHKRAAMVIQSHGSLILMVLIAAVAIVVFITVFASRHQWDQYEQRYQELLMKREGEQKDIPL